MPRAFRCLSFNDSNSNGFAGIILCALLCYSVKGLTHHLSRQVLDFLEKIIMISRCRG